MNYILAKIKGIRKKPFSKLISDASLFEPITVDPKNCVDYSPDHNLDEDSWFKISNFSQKSFCIGLLKTPFDSKDFDDIAKDKLSKISYIFSVQSNNFYFQKTTPSSFLKKKLISLGEKVEIEASQDRLVINERPDAVYLTETDTLIFRNLATISSIFLGIDELYKEATETEVQGFLTEPFIELAEDYTEEKVSKPNRKRIALAIKTLDSMSKEEKENIHGYIDSYCSGKLRFDDTKNTFEISNDEELKYLLYGIEQRFYTTPFGSEKRLANSIIRLD